MTRFLLRNKAAVVLVWIGLAVLGVLAAPGLGPHLDYSYTTPGEPGFKANAKIANRFGIDAAFEAHLPVLRLPLGHGMETPAGRDAAARAFAAAHKAGPVTIVDYASTHDPVFLLNRGAATWAIIDQPNPDKGPGTGEEERMGPALQSAVPAGGQLTLTGFAQMLSNAGPNGSNLLRALALAAGLAFLVLLLVYGSVIAILPIIMAIPAVCVTVLAVRVLTVFVPVSYFIQYMITLLSLGVAIDFSLILVIRWREERERGADREAAVLAANASSGRAILLSGLTASIGLASLIVLPVPFLRSVGYGSMLIPFVAVAIAVTLLPIALATVGPALDRTRLWRDNSTTYSHFWEAWGRAVLRHRWVAAASGVLLLVLLGAPAFWINTAEPMIGSLSQRGPEAAAFRTLQANGIPSAVDFPIQVITHGAAAGRAQALDILAHAPGVFRAFSPENLMFRNKDDSLITVIPTEEGGTASGRAIVTDLRARLRQVPGGVEVGGSTAADMSFTHAVYGNFPLLLGTVALVTFMVLALALRSVVLAAKAVVLNIVSLGAAFGFMVIFWQAGHGSALFYGVPATGAIRDWIPVVVFASLFGLSMDYEVFVLARIREEYDRLRATDEAIVQGLARTGRLVTSAALILMVTFLSLSTDPNQIVEISATALAAGVIVDAVLIRTLLVPALVSLLGRWNWWFPAAFAR